MNINIKKELLELWILVIALIVSLIGFLFFTTPAHAEVTDGTAKELCAFGLAAFCK